MDAVGLELVKKAAQAGELIGIFDGIPNEVYHSFKNYVSSSALVKLRKSPAHYLAYITEPFEPTKDMLLGTAIHEYVLERELFDSRNILGPDLNRNTNAWKAFVAENEGKQIWKPEEMDRIVKTGEKIKTHKKIAPMLAEAKFEQSIFWKDPATGLLCKCRPDILLADGTAPDIKSTKDASPEEFPHSVKRYGYHIRAAFYRAGIKAVLGLDPETAIIVAAEKASPFLAQPYVFSPDSRRGVHPLEEGERERVRLMSLLKESKDLNQWGGYGDGFLPLSLPGSENHRIAEEEFG